MRGWALIALILASLLTAAPASACRTIEQRTSFLHRTLAQDAAGDFAAEVEITHGAGSRLGDFDIVARVVKVLRGEFAGRTVRFAPMPVSNCYDRPQRGNRGILVGRVVSVSGDELVIQPTRTRSELQRRAEGWR